ncbi:MAG: sigma-54 dependent transcriptional regulator, partial [Gammaproteobacteria bacterium]|nr:sigma-54 dependent transcriptional regulator [Gammaproteobacteria bacterium]
ESVTAARELLEEDQFDLCFTDMQLPDGNGIELVKHIQKHFPNMPVAVITAYGSMETAVEALKAGAFDFVSKPIHLENLRNLVNTALKLRSVEEVAQQPQDESGDGQKLLGDSNDIRELRAFINKVSRKDAPVHIRGESGTGKELVAQLIHEKGPRRDGPFVPVNCGAIPNELMESEFFGHKKGSFTGAVTDKEGLFQAANHGTLFLDEVADLPLAMQVKLLRAIQERAVRPVGSTQEKPVDVRLVSATHQNLEKLVKEKRFRQDLYYRINVIELRTPSLRGHPEDIAILARHVLKSLAGDEKPASISDEAVEKLAQYAFPGNVRELENLLERALALCDENTITEDDLFLPSTDDPATATDALGITVISSESAVAGPGHHESLDDYVARIERDAIEKALKETNNNKTEAAKQLGISFRSLRYKIQKLDIG